MKTSLVFLCLFLSCILLAFSLLCNQENAQTAITGNIPTEQDLTLTDIPVTDISGLSVKSKGGAFGIIPEGLEFETLGDYDIDFDHTKLAAILYTACHLTADSRLENPEPAKEYGLDPARVQISLIPSGGETVRLFIGDSCPVSDQYYARTEHSDAIYLISSVNGDILIQSPEDLRDMSLFPADASFESITIENTTGSYTLTRAKSSVSGLFEMTSPVSCAPDWSAVNEQVLTPLASLVPDHFVARNASLKDYSLDNPDIILTLSFDNQTRKCLFAENEDGDFFCTSDDGANIYRISADKIEFLETPYSSLLGSTLYRRSISEISRITLTAEDQTYTFQISGSSESLRSSFAGHEFNAADTQQFYNLLTAIPIAGELNGDAVISSDSMITLTLSLRDSGLDILEFLPLQNEKRCCAVSINGQTQFATYSNVPILIIQYYLAMLGAA